MCQVNSRRVNKKTITGYKCYFVRKGKRGLVSIMFENPIPKRNVWVRKNTSEPFHAFAFKKDALGVNEEVVFEVLFRKNIRRGHWCNPGDEVTLTADEMRIIRRVK